LRGSFFLLKTMAFSDKNVAEKIHDEIVRVMRANNLTDAEFRIEFLTPAVARELSRGWHVGINFDLSIVAVPVFKMSAFGFCDTQQTGDYVVRAKKMRYY